MTLPITIAVQAGGNSTRMGQNKALIDLAGKPLIAHVIDRLRPLSADLLIVCRDPAAMAFLGVPAYTDILPDLGPIGGLATVLTYAAQPNVLMVGCDMPFANPALFAALIQVQQDTASPYDAVVPYWNERPQPLHALYHRQCLPRVTQMIDAGERRMHRLLDSLNVRVFTHEETARYDADGRAFTNLNTPDDVAAAHARMQTMTADEKESPCAS